MSSPRSYLPPSQRPLMCTSPLYSIPMKERCGRSATSTTSHGVFAGKISGSNADPRTCRDASSPPPQITNRIGRVLLRKGPQSLNSAPHVFLVLFDCLTLTRSVVVTLASGFDILDGTVPIIVPDVEPGEDYAVVRECNSSTLISLSLAHITYCLVFGDSGNFSPAFTITN